MKRSYLGWKAKEGLYQEIQKGRERARVCKHVCDVTLSCEPLDPATPEVFRCTSFINQCIFFPFNWVVGFQQKLTFFGVGVGGRLHLQHREVPRLGVESEL